MSRVTTTMISWARRAYERRDKILRGKTIRRANDELNEALTYLAAAELCEPPLYDEYGLVSLTTEQAALIYPKPPEAPAPPAAPDKPGDRHA
ncbi:MAG: hypothetical protein V3V34_11650 [Kiloniellales bacterium]